MNILQLFFKRVPKNIYTLFCVNCKEQAKLNGSKYCKRCLEYYKTNKKQYVVPREDNAVTVDKVGKSKQKKV